MKTRDRQGALVREGRCSAPAFCRRRVAILAQVNPPLPCGPGALEDGPLSLLAVPSRSTDLVLEKGEQAELRFFIAKHPWEVGRLLSDARKLYPETKTGDNEKGDIEANYKAKRKGGAKRKREDADAESGLYICMLCNLFGVNCLNSKSILLSWVSFNPWPSLAT